MTDGEYRFLVLALGWILASVPLALLVWQVWWRPQKTHAVIPPADDVPAGSFLDVALPPHPPEREESGVPVRHWKRGDGWVALAAVMVLSLMMGPLASGPPAGTVENAGEGGALAERMSAEFLAVMLAFQLGFAGLLLYYLKVVRKFEPGRLFGLRRIPLPMVPAYALGFLIPGFAGLVVISNLAVPPLLRWLGLENAPPQEIVTALMQTPDPGVKIMAMVTVGLGAPLMEEMVFRGFLYSVAKRFTHWSYAAAASSLFFALVHANAASFVPLAVLGLLFTLAYERTRSLLVPMCMHSLFNLAQVSLMFFAPQLMEGP